MKVDINILKNHEYIKGNNHPTLDLWIWNYTSGCQFDRAWDEYTTMCRGLITDSIGNVIARPFPKFFNVGETENTLIYNLPHEIPEIRAKEDGSLGIMYYDNDKVCIASRGSFTSDQAKWATNWMRSRRRSEFLHEFTYLYEIIYPDNKIVINYGSREELVLLAVINTDDGHELAVDTEGARLGFNVPKLITKDIWALQEDMESLPSTEEGYVLRFLSGLRVKMKGHEYIRKHKAIMHCSTTAIWELLMMDGSVGILLQDLPDELHDWVRTEVIKLQNLHANLIRQVQMVVQAVTRFSTRKSQAEYVLKYHKEISGMVFGLLDGKDITEQAWKKIKPVFKTP